MAIIDWEKKETTAWIMMNNGVNRQNLDFGVRMNEVFDEIIEDESVKAIVLTSSDEKNFSQGVDVEWLGGRFAEQDYESIKGFMYTMNRVFKRLLLMPVPVIAAINGHAFGNGAILSCACDFRFMRRDRGYFCFPEVDLGIPFLPGMVAFVRKAVPEYRFNEMKLTGRRVTAQELEKDHIIEKACENPEELFRDAGEFAGTFQKKRGIFGEHKLRMHQHIVEAMENKDPVYIDGLNLFIED